MSPTNSQANTGVSDTLNGTREYRGQLLVVVAFAYILLFELVFSFYPTSLTPMVMAAKLALPLLLLVAATPGIRDVVRQPSAMVFLLLMSVFVAWGLIPTLIGVNPAGGVVEWFKHLPLLAYFISLVALSRMYPIFLRRLSVLIVAWGLFAVAQYGAVVATHGWSNPVHMFGMPIALAGPLGLFGNVDSVMYLPGAGALVRFCGWWSEPANASAFMLVAAYLALSLANGPRRVWWRVAAALCGTGTLLAFSNAGYIALGLSLFVGGLLPGALRTGAVRWHRRALTIVAALLFLGLGAAGRWFAANRLDDPVARAVLGLRSTSLEGNLTGGRAKLAGDALRVVALRPSGEGYGYLSVALDRDVLSATAPIFWLQLAGVPGILMISTAVGYGLFSAAGAARSRRSVRQVQAWTAVIVVQLSYGQWMNPLFLTAAAMALSNAVLEPPPEAPASA